MRATRAGAVFGLLGLLAASLIWPQAVAGADGPVVRLAKFERERASRDVREVANWVVHSGDNHIGDDSHLPFVIIDKKEARVYVFDLTGRLRGAAPALLGIGKGDVALPGIGARELSGIPPEQRVTQAGRFVAYIGLDSAKEDVLWLDYEGGLAMHRVITSNPKERRLERLNSPTPSDNRISYGCINIPVKFYEEVVQPTFKGTKGIVYVLPETMPHHKVFASYEVKEAAQDVPDVVRARFQK